MLDPKHQRQLTVTMQRPSRLLPTDFRKSFMMRNFVIKWTFNVSRAPCSGRFFGRLISIMERSLVNKIGRAMLQYHELEDVSLDVKYFMNKNSR